MAVTHIKEGVVDLRKASYKVHDITSILNEEPYFTLHLRNLKLPYSGEYTFKLFVDKECKSEESITVALDKEDTR